MAIKVTFEDGGLSGRLQRTLSLKGPMQRAASRIVKRAKANAPVRTGRLQRGIRARIEDNGTRAVFDSEAPYWQFVEEGTTRFAGRHYFSRAIDADTAVLRVEIERDVVNRIEG